MKKMPKQKEKDNMLRVSYNHKQRAKIRATYLGMSIKKYIQLLIDRDTL